MSSSDSLQKALVFAPEIQRVKEEIGRVVIGQEEAVEALLNAVFCNGHVLMVGVPGLAKTLLVKTISTALGLDFKRVQFTPDLMPSDILGAEILDAERKFSFVKGPIFTQVLLADEINRTPPKTQAALLEAMQEKQVTAAGQLYPLPEPFFVLATQNPIEQEGTYPLPEAQLDRFMYQVVLGYPSFEQEQAILKQTTASVQPQSQPILNAEKITSFQQAVRSVPVVDQVFEYTVNLVHKTRPEGDRAPANVRDYLRFGAGPRAGQNLILGAKCHALMNGKLTVDREDVQRVAPWVLAHRLVPNFRAEAESVSMVELVRSLY
ncbi:MAG: MoxR family ATPase [Bacteroidetes bacterium]|nr:MoxR family ATPase [Bacteroidota bacterium]